MNAYTLFAEKPKFRAWNKELGEMWIGGYVQFDTGNVWFDNEDGDQFEYTQDEFPLMQYTGLKDRNGKEVYEGDIFRQKGMDDDIIIGKVMWDEGYHGFRVQEGQYIFHWLKFAGEVIGNIYENPELLIKHDTYIQNGHCNNGGIYGETIY